MSEFFRQLSTQARQERLSPSEKQALRVRLYNHMEHNPLQPLTVKKEAVSSTRPTPSAYYWYSPRFAMPVALVLIVGLSGGTAFASQDSLPGDTLYSFKVNVTEQLQVAFAWSEQDKAAVNASLAATRLEEAESLAVAGKLDTKTSEALAASFDKHAEVAQTLAIKFEEKDPGSAAKLAAEFDSKLLAHAAILEEIEISNKDVQPNSGSLAIVERVKSRQQGGGAVTMAMVTTLAVDAVDPTVASDTSVTNQNARTLTVPAPVTTMMAVEATTTTNAKVVAPTSTTKQAKYAAPSKNAKESSNKKVEVTDEQMAIALSKQATSSIAVMIKNFGAIKRSLDVNVVAQIEAQITDIQKLYASGEVELTEGNAAAAKETFTQVLKLSTKLDTYFKAGKKINVKILSSLLNLKTAVVAKENVSNSGKGAGEATVNGKGEIKIAPTNTSDTPATPPPAGTSSEDEKDTVKAKIKVNVGL